MLDFIYLLLVIVLLALYDFKLAVDLCSFIFYSTFLCHFALTAFVFHISVCKLLGAFR